LNTVTRPLETDLSKHEKKLAEKPPMYEVCLLNDDYTPMEFVIIVLQKFFAMKKENATQIMLKVHREGRGVCGVYSKDIAASKVSAVLDFAKVYQHPLQCIMEKK
jgi:ATP-dependent Clp protease adaptor protein ClpS